jgi:hypothetical protein
LHRHGRATKPVRDHGLSEVGVNRYKCTCCSRTLRHYPGGVSKQDQSHRTVVLTALMYALGLSSCSAASHLLGAFGAAVGKSKVRYKTMRGDKSPEGTINAIALTQWLYNSEYEHDLAQEMAP